MEEIKINIGQNKNTSSYIKVNTEDDIELYDFNYEKEIPVTNNTIQIKNNKKALEQQQSFCYKRIGNTFCFYGDRYGNPKIVIGPHWPMYVCFCGFMSFIFIILFYSFWELLNPGMPTINENSFIGMPREKYKYCNECKLWVSNEKSTEHCFECNICVEGYDHHCPWTGKCIAKNNIVFFYIFVTSILLSFSFFVFALTYAASKYEKKRRKLI